MLIVEHVPRILPKDEDPSLVNRNKRMLGQLLGTLEVCVNIFFSLFYWIETRFTLPWMPARKYLLNSVIGKRLSTVLSLMIPYVNAYYFCKNLYATKMSKI